jgi:RNA polymerase sigma factor (sigma-70 family)
MEAKRHVLGKSYTNLKFYERPKYFNRNSENLKRFFDEIRKSKYKPFETKEEEDLVVAKAYSGEPGWEKAKEELINRNIRAVVSKARNYASDDESDLTDYISEGVYGLTLAFDSYNPKSGTKFLTYALIYAFKYMNEYRREKENIVKQFNRNRVSSTVGKLAEKFFAENEREPTLSELKELCLENNIRIVNEMDLENVIIEDIDVTDSRGDDDDQSNAQYGEIDDFDVRIDNEYINRSLKNIIDTRLSCVEKCVINSKYGLDGFTEMDEKSIAEDLGISQYKVVKFLEEAKEKIREQKAVLF